MIKRMNPSYISEDKKYYIFYIFFKQEVEENEYLDSVNAFVFDENGYCFQQHINCDLKYLDQLFKGALLWSTDLQSIGQYAPLSTELDKNIDKLYAREILEYF